MRQEIIKYLKENKDKYSEDVLVEALLKAGYKKEDIIEAWQSLANNEKIEPNINKEKEIEETPVVFNIKNRKFLYTFFGTILTLFIIQVLNFFLGIGRIFSGGPLIYVILIPLFLYRFRKDKNLLLGFVLGIVAYFFLGNIFSNFLFSNLYSWYYYSRF